MSYEDDVAQAEFVNNAEAVKEQIEWEERMIWRIIIGVGFIFGVSLLAGCASPEASLQYGQKRCDLIGYEMDRERVPTLQCVERGYDIHQERFNGAVVAGATTLAPLAMY